MSHVDDLVGGDELAGPVNVLPVRSDDHRRKARAMTELKSPILAKYLIAGLAPVTDSAPASSEWFSSVRYGP